MVTLAAAMWIYPGRALRAGNVTLTAADQMGTSSFNTYTNWNNGFAPSATNDYTGAFGMRTPASSSSFTFAGRSLQIDAGGMMGFKTGGGGVITVGDLRLAGGTIAESAGTGGNTAILAGGITVTNSSIIDAWQGSDSRIILVRSTMTGAAANSVTIRSANDPGGIVSYDTNAKAYSGNTIIDPKGILRMGLTNAIPFGAGNGSVTVNGTLRLNGFDTSINGLSGTGTVQNFVVGAATLTVGNNNDTSSFSGLIQDGAAGPLNLTKIGSGTLTLTATNAYTGSTTVSNGTLSVLHAMALNTNDIYLAGSGTLNLNFTGTMTNTTLYINGAAMFAGSYSSNNVAQISGNGVLRTLWPLPPPGMVITVR
jgi:fibronectin-binding autotransporter adhesin